MVSPARKACAVSSSVNASVFWGMTPPLYASTRAVRPARASSVSSSGVFPSSPTTCPPQLWMNWVAATVRPSYWLSWVCRQSTFAPSAASQEETSSSQLAGASGWRSVR